MGKSQTESQGRPMLHNLKSSIEKTRHPPSLQHWMQIKLLEKEPSSSTKRKTQSAGRPH